MKILVIPSWYPPNGGYFFKEHALSLADLGAEVHVLACHFRSIKTWGTKRGSIYGDKPLKTEKYKNITEHSSYTWIIPFTEEPNFKSWVKAAWRMFNHYLNLHGKPDIIQVHSSFPAGYLASLINIKHDIPYVITEHRSRFIFNSNAAKGLFRKWHYPIIKQALTSCSALVGVSEALLPKLKEIAGPTLKNALVIPNMVDTDFFIPADESDSTISSQFRFITVAYLEEVKGIDVLLKAFLQIHKKNPGKYKLTIAGDGQQRQCLEKFVIDNDLDKNVVFTGMQNRNQVKMLMQQSDAFVLPTRFEAFGVVFIEAMSCGLPVIATKAGGPETFIPELAGMLTEIDNEKMLAENMEKMCSNYKSFSKQAIREYTINNFSKQSIAEKYLELYKKSLNKV